MILNLKQLYLIPQIPDSQRMFPRGSLILWKMDHLSSGIRTSSGKRDMGNGTRYPLGFGPLILWKTGHGKRDTISVGIRTTYPLVTSSGNREFGNRFLTVPSWNTPNTKGNNSKEFGRIQIVRLIYFYEIFYFFVNIYFFIKHSNIAVLLNSQ